MTGITEAEWNRWRDDDRMFKEELRQAIIVQHDVNLRHEADIAGIKGKLKAHEDLGNTRTAWLSAIIAAIVGSMISLFNIKW